MKHHDQKRRGEERVYSILQTTVEGSQGRNLKQKPQRDDVTGFSCRLAFSYLFNTASANLLGSNPFQWVGPSNINEQSRECPTGSLASLMEAASELRFPLPQISQGPFVKFSQFFPSRLLVIESGLHAF